MSNSSTNNSFPALSTPVHEPNATSLYGLFGLLVDRSVAPLWMRCIAAALTAVVVCVGVTANITILIGFAKNRRRIIIASGTSRASTTTGDISRTATVAAAAAVDGTSASLRHTRNVNIFVLTLYNVAQCIVCAQSGLSYAVDVKYCSYTYITTWASVYGFVWYGKLLTMTVLAYCLCLVISKPTQQAYEQHETLQRTWIRVGVIGMVIPLAVYGIGFINNLVNNKNDHTISASIAYERCIGDGMLKRPFGTMFWSLVFHLIPLVIMFYYVCKAYARINSAVEIVVVAATTVGEAGGGGGRHELTSRQAQLLANNKKRALRLLTWIVLTMELLLLPFMAGHLVVLAFALRFLRYYFLWYYRLYELALFIAYLKCALDPLLFMFLLPDFRQSAVELWRPIVERLLVLKQQMTKGCAGATEKSAAKANVEVSAVRNYR